MTLSESSSRSSPRVSPAIPRRQRVEDSLARARQAVLDRQFEDGHWCGELEGDSILESEYILTMYFLGRGGEEKVAAAATHLRRLQHSDGGWSTFPDADSEVSATVKAYFALKLVGDEPDREHMKAAREAAQRLGGLRACNSYTKLYLAIFGQYPWRLCPGVPPEMILLPRWSPFDLYSISAWTRAIVVPLSIIWALKPRCEVPAAASISELDVEGSARHRARAETLRERLWATFFEFVDVTIRAAEALRLRPFRSKALAKCEQWILSRINRSDGLGAIFPPIINTIIALRCLGYDASDPVLAQQIGELEALEIRDDDALRVQPCKSPVWDTAQALNAMLHAAEPSSVERSRKAARWLLDREVSAPGDWQIRNPDVPVGGWYFEYANEFYPDCDDTAEVVLALSQVPWSDAGEEARSGQAVRRGVEWLSGMQNRDGGWASFDRGCDQEVLTFVPFADHNAMIDPSTVDITGRVLEALVACDVAPDGAPVRAGVDFIRREQEEDGSWYGRWGANHIYGTWLALSGLSATGLDTGDPTVRRGADWLLACQNDDGGWGESLRSYGDPAWRGRGESTAAQTSWALCGLIAVGEGSQEAVARGIDFLLASQLEDGSWHDRHWTGTGFPEVFYLNYHFYSLYFPLLSLSSYLRDVLSGEGAEQVA